MTRGSIGVGKGFLSEFSELIGLVVGTIRFELKDCCSFGMVGGNGRRRCQWFNSRRYLCRLMGWFYEVTCRRLNFWI